MSLSAHGLLRALEVQLRDRAAAIDDHMLPPELQAALDRCRVLAARSRTSSG